MSRWRARWRRDVFPTPFGSSSFERSREASVENPFSTAVLDRLEPPLEANGYL